MANKKQKKDDKKHIGLKAPLETATKLKTLSKQYTFNRSVFMLKLLDDALADIEAGNLAILGR